MPSIAARDSWVSEGAYMGWATPLFDAAELVVWMQVPARVALYRIVARHVKAELSRTNRFPGWRRLMRFWRWSAQYYFDRNAHVLGFYGVPETAEHAAELMRLYAHKIVVCRGFEDALTAISALHEPE